MRRKKYVKREESDIRRKVVIVLIMIWKYVYEKYSENIIILLMWVLVMKKKYNEMMIKWMKK